MRSRFLPWQASLVAPRETRSGLARNDNVKSGQTCFASRGTQGRRDDNGNASGSGVVEEEHEAEVHVGLIVAVEESWAGIVGGEVDVGGGIGRDDENVFAQTGERSAGDAGGFESVTMKMQGMIVGTVIEHTQAIAPALLQRRRDGIGIRFSVDEPGIEGALAVEF